jgi:hypothetical protein
VLPSTPFGNQWWSADVDNFTRNEGVKFMKEATAANQPFYLQLWWHMSHDRIDPREEQMEGFPAKETCLFLSKASGQTTCPSRIFWGSQVRIVWLLMRLKICLSRLRLGH